MRCTLTNYGNDIRVGAVCTGIGAGAEGLAGPRESVLGADAFLPSSPRRGPSKNLRRVKKAGDGCQGIVLIYCQEGSVGFVLGGAMWWWPQ